MKKFKRTGLIFFVIILMINGCSGTKKELAYLYQADADTDMQTAAEQSESVKKDEAAYRDSPLQDEADLTQKQESDDVIAEEFVCVYVCGAVVSPGVYELQKGARVHQAVAAAGGLTQDADLLLVNQARVLEDGEQIRIYTKEEAQNGVVQDRVEMQKDGSSGGMVSINQASEDELMSLPGIGKTKAESIIAYREEHGSFQKIEDLMKIPGIKEAVFSKIKDKITL